MDVRWGRGVRPITGKRYNSVGEDPKHLEHDDRAKRDSRALRQLAGALALACVAIPGALPVASGPTGRVSDPLVLLVWLALVAPATGAAAARFGLALWPNGLALAGTWAALLVAIAGTSERVVPTPFWSALVVLGLVVGGFALGRVLERTSTAVALFLATLALVLLPGMPGNFGVPWSPASAALLLDLSPATLAVEAAGIDWMRTAGVYTPVGADRLMRSPWAPELAGPATVVVACALWGAAELVRRRRSKPNR